ncbi:MAG: hypothetical protein KBH85_03300 [Lachnospiraceae bacterium]|jgi:hypothetical protein|nr:hypothetical protein [Lachnospiraceae bacterium]
MDSLRATDCCNTAAYGGNKRLRITEGLIMFISGIAGVIVLSITAIKLIPYCKQKREQTLNDIEDGDDYGDDPDQ